MVYAETQGCAVFHKCKKSLVLMLHYKYGLVMVVLCHKEHCYETCTCITQVCLQFNATGNHLSQLYPE